MKIFKINEEQKNASINALAKLADALTYNCYNKEVMPLIRQLQTLQEIKEEPREEEVAE